MSAIYELEYIVKNQLPQTSMWQDLQYDTGATDEEMEEVLEQHAETIADAIYSDLEPMAENWMNRHAYHYVEDMQPDLLRLINDRDEDDDDD
mgnify:CR=1 FL=1